MKRKLLHTIWVAAVVLLAASCEQEELPGVGADGTQTLAITVTDGGYAPADRNGGSPAGVPQTRAVENGYITKFTAGDACGLYIVRGGELAYANVKLTATAATDGTLTWQPEAGVTLAGGFNGEAYYLYYPYRDDSYMADKIIAASATGNDADFFAPLVSTWQPQVDQSKYTEGYTASDLMTATATTNKNGKTIALSFAMTHRMALAVIELPKTKYVFTNTGGSAIPDYTVPASADFTGSDAKPCRMTDGSYRYIVNPTTTAPEITGSYADGSKEFIFTPSSATGSYKTYKIDGGGVVVKQHNLQVGDYFCSSGNASGWYIIPKELAPTESDNCIGIVLKAGRDDSGNWADNGNYTLKGSTISMSKVHGYVLALRDANGGNFCQWGSDGTAVGSDRNQTTGFNGYSNTQTIVALNKDKNWNLSDAFPAVYHAVNYETVCPAPSKTSGWFLPSGGQCQYWLNNRDVILRSIQNAGGDGWEDRYWSSSEYRNIPAHYAYYMFILRYGSMYDAPKYANSAVRACLAF